MSVDRWLSIAGIAEGIIGILLTVAVGVFPRTFSTQTVDLEDVAPPMVDQRDTINAGGDVNVSNQATVSTTKTTTNNTVHHTTVVRTDGTSSDDDALGWIAGAVTVGFVVFMLMAFAAVEFVGIEFTVAHVAAVVAVSAGALGIGGIVSLVRHQGLSGPACFVFAVLFVTLAGVAHLPRWLRSPLGSQHRFDDLRAHLAQTGTLNARVHDALKAYGPDLVLHVLIQAFGIVVLIVVVIVCAFSLVLGRSDVRWAHRTPLAISFALLAALGISSASGGFAAAIGRAETTNSYTAGAEPTGGNAPAPALELASDLSGALTLTIARCGAERAVSVTADRGEVRPQPVTPSSPNLLPFTVQPNASDAPIKISVVTTRSYRVAVQFPALKPGEVLFARPGTTPASFAAAGYAC